MPRLWQGCSIRYPGSALPQLDLYRARIISFVFKTLHEPGRGKYGKSVNFVSPRSVAEYTKGADRGGADAGMQRS